MVFHLWKKNPQGAQAGKRMAPSLGTAPPPPPPPPPAPIQLSSTGGRSAPFPKPCFMGWEGEDKAVFPRSLLRLRETLSAVRACGYSGVALVCDAGGMRPSSATRRVPWGGSQVRLVLLGKLLILALPHHLHPISGPSASPQQNLPRMVFLGATK